MPRKNEDLLFVLSLLPWWVSAAIAVFAFVGIAYVFPSVSIESPLWAFLIPLQTMATYFGTLVAVVFLLPAALSYIDRTRKKRLLDRQQNLESVRHLPWRQFEELVAEAFRRDGFKVTENTDVGADGGVDIRLRKGRDLYLVQCKNWRRQSVGVATVREMFGVLAAESAQRVLIVCSGTFTPDAVRFAEGKPIDLVDGARLDAMIARVRRNDGTARRPVNLGDQESLDAKALGVEPERYPDPPICPRCGGNLVVKTARRGRNAGRQFLGCETFPKCRFVKDHAVSTT